ncbi:MAG: T9SS type A sorting domain-containing protein, partial [Bacteroidetes bacterium]|nr:T9SS type A sorting domain-containing protein [Bacteroidota bacterium]
TDVLSLAVSGTNLFAGTWGGGVFLSTNNGTSWTAASTGLTNTDVEALAVSGTNLFAGTYGGVFLSTNNGISWTATSTGLTNTDVLSLAVSSTNLFAGTWGGIFLSTNNGTNWTEVNTGLTNTSVMSLASDLSGNLFAGTYGGGVWRRPLSEMTAVERLSTDVPTHFILSQNYPNPFNPATTISFSLTSKSFVSLKVFDALGREVSILLADELPAGTYARQWNAAALPSGVYFYRLVANASSEGIPLGPSGQAGSFSETKKLTLIR